MHGRYFNAYNVIYKNNRLYQSYLALDKYWVTESGYFRPVATVELGVGITDGKLFFCRNISELSRYRKVTTRDYNYRAFYDCFKNPIPVDCGSPDLNIPPMTMEDSPRQNKKA